MNPLVIGAALFSAIVGLKRTCPNCKRTQIVPAKKKRETVSCKFCEADIPPKK